MTNWERNDEKVGLVENEVAVWRVSLDCSEFVVEQLSWLLSADELTRANRFKFAQHRRRFIVARASLRRILGDYVACPPADLIFQTTSFGKPWIDTPLMLEFNLSHSHELAVIGVARQRKIGIDVEYLDRRHSSLDIARHYFSSHEADALFSLPKEEQQLAFLRIWTRKEAYIKAIGEGLSHPLRTFAMTLDEPPRLLYDENNELAPQQWSIISFTPYPQYVATLMVEGQGMTFSFYDYSS